MNTILNRYNVKLTVGDTVSVQHPRGGTFVAVIRAFETKGSFVRAYGAVVLFESGQSASPDECAVLIPAQHHSTSTKTT